MPYKFSLPSNSEVRRQENCIGTHLLTAVISLEKAKRWESIDDSVSKMRALSYPVL